MSIELMRKAIQEVYDGDAWKNKVARMKDEQVMAVYRRFLDQNKLKK